MELVEYKKIEYNAQGFIASSATPKVRKYINMCTTVNQMWLHSTYEIHTEQCQDRLFQD